MVENQFFICDQYHIVRTVECRLLPGRFLLLSLAQFQDLIETVQDLIVRPLVIDKATDIQLLQSRMRQPAQPIPLVALLLWHDGNYLHIVVGVKDRQLHDQELELFQDKIARTDIADRPMAEISHDRKIGNLLMPSVESIALLF
ncbi:hypothetical protein D8871_08615 [Streptococcus sanguinis]|nr:hypothetical protein D8871_08615 [Streptococcus sanguinis]